MPGDVVDVYVLRLLSSFLHVFNLRSFATFCRCDLNFIAYCYRCSLLLSGFISSFIRARVSARVLFAQFRRVVALFTSSEDVFCSVTCTVRSMSQQTWPLSQDANKSSGLCSVCRATRQLHHKDGTVHKHGPRDNPCPGSNKPPLSASQNLPGPSGQSQPSVSPSGSQPAPSAQSSFNTQSVSWSPSNFPLIKHIPKSARPACASHLAKLLRVATA